MEIIEIMKDSPTELKSRLIDLLGSQMEAIGDVADYDKIGNALEITLGSGTRAHILVMLDQNEKIIGLCVFNVCCGIQSGGDYIWINEIHIEKKERRKGYGEVLLEFVIDWAKTNQCKYVAAQTWPENIASQGLFEKAGYNKSCVIWLDKKI